MTEDEWKATPAGQAITALLRFAVSATLMTLSGEAGKWASGILNWIASKSEEADYKQYFDPKIQSGFRKGVVVVAAWSALESGIEDFVKGLMQTDPQLFVNFTLKKNRKIDTSRLISEEYRNEMYKAMLWTLKDEHVNDGFDRWEELFTRIGLTGPSVAPAIRVRVRDAQAIRHVWAHNAGIADADFQRNAVRLKYPIGQLVDIPLNKLGLYIAAIMSYAMVIGNRDRDRYGIAPLPMDGPPAERPVGRAYVNMYPVLKAKT